MSFMLVTTLVIIGCIVLQHMQIFDESVNGVYGMRQSPYIATFAYKSIQSFYRYVMCKVLMYRWCLEMIKNVPMPSVPSELIADFDPSALTLNRSKRSRKSSLPKVDEARLKALRLNDFEKFVMVLLAAVNLVSNTQMKAILTCVPAPSSPVGFEGAMSDLMERFGVAFNIKKAVGGLHNKDAAYQAMNRLAHKGLVRALLQGQNVRVRAELAGKGVEVGWALTPLGAAVLLALTIKQGLPLVTDDEGNVIHNPNLTLDNIKFAAHESQIGLETQVHDLGVSAYLTGLFVGASHFCNRDNKPITVDVCQIVGDGKDYDINGTKISRPDLAAVVFIKSVFIPLFVEWNTSRSTQDLIRKKSEAHIRLMTEGNNKWLSGRPWLIHTCPTEDKVKGYETAIRTAARNRGMLNPYSSDYDPTDWAGIAVCVHEDIGKHSPYGAIYRVFDYKTGKLTDEKFTLVSLYRTKVVRPVDEEPKVEEPTPQNSAPSEWWKMKKGATTALVGYREDQMEITPASANIGWSNEVA